MNQLLNRVCISFVFLLLLIFTSCRQDASFNELQEEIEVQQAISYPNVDARLWPFFESFEAEAKARGLNVNLKLAAITGDIAPIDGEHVAGQCTYSSQAPNHISVDDEFWTKTGESFREFIIFHELGHCYLNRGHREDAFANGICKSLMRSGVDGCFDNYKSTTRALYLDELFEPNKIP